MKAETFLSNALKLLVHNWFQLALLFFALFFFFSKNKRPADSSEAPLYSYSPANGNPRKASAQMNAPEVTDSAKQPVPITMLRDINDMQIRKFIERFQKVAIAENEKFGIPASIVLAVAIVQSHCGTNKLSDDNRNYFGLICEYGKLGSCSDSGEISFRSYETAWESFRDFSLFCRKNFAPLKGKNYLTWAKGMEMSGFGEGEQFSSQVIQIIENYRLFELDVSK